MDNKLLGYAVPFKNKLENLLSSPELNNLASVNDNNLLISRNIYSSVTHGRFIKEKIEEKKKQNALSNKEKDILMIALYYDDIEVVNAIGSSRKKHKLGNLKNSKIGILIFFNFCFLK